MNKFVCSLFIPALLSVGGAAQPLQQAVSANPTLSVIGEAPDFTLSDPAGEPVTLSQHQGKVVLLAFAFTTCPGVCPLISSEMATLQTELKREGLFGTKVNMLSVTVDPNTDTAEVLAKYAAQFNADKSGPLSRG